jgi:hypothetical protein
VAVFPPRNAKGRQPLELGQTPIERRSGAYVGDTVVLTNPERGIRYEEVIEFGQANDTHPIEKTFREATLKVRTKPLLRNATIWRGTARIGQVGIAMKVFEGVQQLEVKADQLAQPVEFEVRIQGGAVLEQEVDVSSAIENKGAP